MTQAILRAQLKVQEVLSGYNHIVMAVSGGSDSDIMIDICKDFRSRIKYVFVDTGIEYEATKKHIDYLQARYNINIEKVKPKKTIPYIIKHYGTPVVSKRASEFISRLQKHNFDFNDESFEKNYVRYPSCKAALRWYCNMWDNNSLLGINHNKLLREFLISQPPEIKISNMCCKKVKEKAVSDIIKQYKCDLLVLGLRKAEGGQRTTIQSCWQLSDDSYDTYYPLLFFNNKDKEIYKKENNIKYSDCYEVYGLKRTGCAGCPFSRDYNAELDTIKKYEPKLYNAVCSIFQNSYNFQNQYAKYRRDYCE